MAGDLVTDLDDPYYHALVLTPFCTRLNGYHWLCHETARCPSTRKRHLSYQLLSIIIAFSGKITSLVSPRDRTLSQRIEWALQHGEPLDQLSADPNILPPSQVR